MAIVPISERCTAEFIRVVDGEVVAQRCHKNRRWRVTLAFSGIAADLCGNHARRYRRKSDTIQSEIVELPKYKPPRRATQADAILRALDERDGMTIGELTEATGLAYGAVLRRMTTLKQEGLARTEGSRAWAPTGAVQSIWWLVRVNPEEGAVSDNGDSDSGEA